MDKFQGVARHMTRHEVIRAFTELDREAFDDKMLKSLGLTERELELLLGALNAIPDGSFEIPNFNDLAKKLKISNPLIQNLKKKGYVKNGSGRGKWEVTEPGLKKMAKAMQVKIDGGGHVSQPEVDEPEDETLLWQKYPIDGMTLAQIADRLNDIDKSVADLLAEKRAVQGQLRKMATPMM